MSYSKDRKVYDTKVITVNEISAENILALCEGKKHALIIKNYTPRVVAEIASQQVSNKTLEYYRNANTIGRIGMAYFETEDNKEQLEIYYRNAVNNIDEIRNLFSPYLSPLDKLRLQLQERWYKGANIENIDNQQMFVGLCRIVEQGVDVLPHQDVFHRDVASHNVLPQLEAQLSVNIYLKMAELGGELELWDLEIEDKEYNRLCNGKYGISRDKVRPADMVIKPDVGDLVLINSRKLHAVRASTGSNRYSISCFIGYYGKNKPLTLWS